jgi:hypothetical protein
MWTIAVGLACLDGRQAPGLSQSRGMTAALETKPVACGFCGGRVDYTDQDLIGVGVVERWRPHDEEIDWMVYWYAPRDSNPDPRIKSPPRPPAGTVRISSDSVRRCPASSADDCCTYLLHLSTGRADSGVALFFWWRPSLPTSRSAGTVAMCAGVPGSA